MNYDEYKFTNNKEENTKVVLERIKIDYDYRYFDEKIILFYSLIDYNVIINKILKSTNKTSYELFYLGYYYDIIQNHKNMEKYYLMATDKDNILAMIELGDYYQYKKINYEKMKKYYLMAIEKDDSNIMMKLGCYYHFIEKNYEEMKKYFLMAVNKGNNISIDYVYNYIKDNTQYDNIVWLYNNFKLNKFYYICYKLQLFNKKIKNVNTKKCNSCFNNTLCILKYNSYICIVCHICNINKIEK